MSYRTPAVALADRVEPGQSNDRDRSSCGILNAKFRSAEVPRETAEMSLLRSFACSSLLIVRACFVEPSGKQIGVQ